MEKYNEHQKYDAFARAKHYKSQIKYISKKIFFTLSNLRTNHIQI